MVCRSQRESEGVRRSQVRSRSQNESGEEGSQDESKGIQKGLMENVMDSPRMENNGISMDRDRG